MLAKYKLNEKISQVDRVMDLLDEMEKKYGKRYCPCVLHKNHNDDTVCPCKEYRESGRCRCGLYVE